MHATSSQQHWRPERLSPTPNSNKWLGFLWCRLWTLAYCLSVERLLCSFKEGAQMETGSKSRHRCVRDYHASYNLGFSYRTSRGRFPCNQTSISSNICTLYERSCWIALCCSHADTGGCSILSTGRIHLFTSQLQPSRETLADKSS